MEDLELILDEMITSYFTDKNTADHFKKMADDFGTQIKKLLMENELTEFITKSGLTAKMSIQNRESFNEEKLIEKLKILNGHNAIKTKEYVDMDILEDLIYNGHIDASQLNDCKVSKEVITLRVTEKKGDK